MKILAHVDQFISYHTFSHRNGKQSKI